ncbi:hypothetical protein [Algoriphagus antarcticus]|jgi:hypothetical protein|uniref:Uncharacterized protein n=1 Tax=Algoriphagus antarcticus TaxID=238540 RepID=A0A3E0E0C9_9BACT|nr:hypothetical protein [Algoriphagus antarcticus]REG91080.1 hypothetical protein C8N25_105193 [Algoriphagus antarcticus]
MTQKNKQIQQISEIQKSLKSVIQIKGYGGELKVDTKEARPNDPVERGEDSVFTIVLPVG